MATAPSKSLNEAATGGQHELLNILKRFRKHKLAVAGAIVVLAVVLISLIAPYVAPYDPIQQDLSLIRTPPSSTHWFGTDQLGRDVLSRIIFGSRVAVLVGLFSVATVFVAGTTLGLVAGYFGGVWDMAISWLSDVLLAFPYMLLAIAISGALGPSLRNTIISIAVWLLPSFIRVVRSAAISIRQREYIAAAHAVGSTHLRVILRHMLPNCMGPVVVYLTLFLARAILAEAGLSFLGLGVQPPTPSWGEMISLGTKYMLIAPHMSVFPGLAILFTVVGLNLLGDGLRDALDPKLKDR